MKPLPRRLRPRRMWAMVDPRWHVLNEGEKRLTMRSPGDTVPTYRRVAVIPVDDMGLLLQRVTEALDVGHIPPNPTAAAISVLQVLGVLTKPARKRRAAAKQRTS